MSSHLQYRSSTRLVAVTSIITSIILLVTLLVLFNGYDAFGPAGYSRSSSTMIMVLVPIFSIGVCIAKLGGFGGATRLTSLTDTTLAQGTIAFALISLLALANADPAPSTLFSNLF